MVLFPPGWFGYTASSYQVCEALVLVSKCAKLILPYPYIFASTNSLMHFRSNIFLNQNNCYVVPNQIGPDFLKLS